MSKTIIFTSLYSSPNEWTGVFFFYVYQAAGKLEILLLYELNTVKRKSALKGQNCSRCRFFLTDIGFFNYV